MRQDILIDRYKRKTAKGLPVTDEERNAYLASRNHPPRPRKAARPRKTITPKDKARYAIEQMGGELWMQKWIDWDDKSIPIGKRRVAYVRYLTMTKGYSLDQAKRASVKFIRDE